MHCTEENCRTDRRAGALAPAAIPQSFRHSGKLIASPTSEEDGSIPEIEAVIADKHGKVLRRADGE